MKNLIKILLLLIFVPEFANACDIEKNFLGKTYADINRKFDISNDFTNDDFFSELVKAKNLKCADIPAIYAELFFVKGKLAKIIFENRSPNTDLLNYATKTYGESSHPLNKTKMDTKNFADFWERDNIMITYNNNFREDDQWDEKLIITSKDLATDLHKNEDVKE